MAEVRLSRLIQFNEVNWKEVPDETGIYVIYDNDEVLYVGMAGRNGRGSLRNRLKDHRSGQIVNMFAQYLFLDRVQFLPEERITHPRDAKAWCRKYIDERCSFRYQTTIASSIARDLENHLKAELKPSLNPT